MAWRYHGRASVSRTNPEAFACCMRCGFWYNRSDLVWQFDYAGPILQNFRILVCTRTCNDKPFVHHIPIVVPPDPIPLMFPSPDPYLSLNDGPTNLTDGNLEIITDTNGAPITATPDGVINTPPFPFAGHVMLRAPFGGPIQQIAVRDEAYAVQVRNDVQQQLPPGVTPQFNATPATNPQRGYNNLNILNNRPGQQGAQYAFPVIVEIPED